MESEKEIWKPVVGYEGLYEVSNLGRVRSVDRFVLQQGRQQIYRGRIMALTINNSGYKTVRLSSNNKKKGMLVHRLVAESFLSNPYNFPCVNHKDENKLNNNLQNLEWCSLSYNVNYGTSTERRARKMGNEIAQYNIDGNLIATYYSPGNAERTTGVSKSTIKDCVKGKLFTAGGFVWKKVTTPCPQHIKVSLPRNHSKIVEQYDIDLNYIASYESGHIAATRTGLKHENILACCRGVCKSCGGFIWVFKGELPRKITPRRNQRGVVMVSLDGIDIKVFDSVSSASKYLGGGKNSGIKQCLYGKNKSAYGYKWRYANG